MDTLVKLKLKPLGVWTTPWQADSLLGAMACGWARSRGQDALRRDFLEPWLAHEPPFVISDAFPGDSLPAPAALPLWWEWPAEERKNVKKYRWMTMSGFCRIQKGRKPNLEDPGISFRDHVRLRNTISRASNTTGAGGELFEVPYSNLNKPDGNLTVFARASSRGMRILEEALEMLGRTGYGADVSVGHGAFELNGTPTPCPELDNIPEAGRLHIPLDFPGLRPRIRRMASGDSSLNTGNWLRSCTPPPCSNVRRSCSRAALVSARKVIQKPFYGVPIGPERLLSKECSRIALPARGIHPIQAAFGLAVPVIWQPEA